MRRQADTHPQAASRQRHASPAKLQTHKCEPPRQVCAHTQRFTLVPAGVLLGPVPALWVPPQWDAAPEPPAPPSRGPEATAAAKRTICELQPELQQTSRLNGCGRVKLRCHAEHIDCHAERPHPTPSHPHTHAPPPHSVLHGRLLAHRHAHKHTKR